MSAPFSSAVRGFAEQVGDSGPVTPIGGRTQWDVGGLPDPGTREVRAPSGVVVFEPAEMTVTCGAATPLGELQQTLGEAGQRVALEGAPEATVGGILAVGRPGLRRLGDGHVRDVLLQVVYIDAEGRPVRNGGPTVKNVSGFDLCKLMVGSLGTLGLFAELTLRCLPRPAASHWFESSGDPLELHQRLYRPVSILWDGSTTWVLLEGHPSDVEAEAATVGLTPSDGPPPPASGRESIRPRDVAALEGEFLAEVGVGVVHREERSPARPANPQTASLCGEIKRRFDPTGRLNPGRSVLA